MRPCYFELLEAKKEYFKLNTKLQGVVYTGTPGIGKSHLCALVVAQKLIAGNVVYLEHNTTLFGDTRKVLYRLDLRSEVRMYNSHEVQDTVFCEKNVVYIVDGQLLSFTTAEVEVQIFVSPSKEIFRPEKKCWPYLYLYTPLFDLDKISK